MTDNSVKDAGNGPHEHGRTDQKEQEISDDQKIAFRMNRIKHKIMILILH